MRSTRSTNTYKTELYSSDFKAQISFYVHDLENNTSLQMKTCFIHKKIRFILMCNNSVCMLFRDAKTEEFSLKDDRAPIFEIRGAKSESLIFYRR